MSGLFNGDEKFEQKFFDDLNTGLQQIPRQAGAVSLSTGLTG